MKARHQTKSSVAAALIAVAVLAVALILATPTNQVWAIHVCANPTSDDSDGDGFTDAQECAGITTAGTIPRTFQVCDGNLPRTECVDPDTKDLFIIYAPAAASLLGANFSPFGPVSDLGVTPHQLTPAQAGPNRTVISGWPQLAISVAESVNANGDILGNCNWGSPLGLDGCVVFTQRIMNFINSVCDTAGDNTTDRNQVFLAYTTHTFLHEVGHTLGGMTNKYESRFGGYHYKCGAGTLMEQCVTYSTRGGRCTWNISSGWNLTLDPASVRLK